MFAKRREAKARKMELARANRELSDIRHDLNRAWVTFNNTSDPALTEACIYEINALRARYDHVIKGVRSYFL
ncbi:MAG: DUF2508 family protein [Candidatus Heteroscillospira sp.]|jgi:hypothetical protein